MVLYVWPPAPWGVQVDLMFWSNFCFISPLTDNNSLLWQENNNSEIYQRDYWNIHFSFQSLWIFKLPLATKYSQFHLLFALVTIHIHVVISSGYNPSLTVVE